VNAAFAATLERRGVELRTGSRLRVVRRTDGQLHLETTGGHVAVRAVINCAGLHADAVAALMGARPEVRIIPFGGEYYVLRRALQRLVPEWRAEDLIPGGAGVRAQAVGRDGALVDDFKITVAPQTIHVLNAPSPAATASLAIGRHIAGLAGTVFQLPGRRE